MKTAFIRQEHTGSAGAGDLIPRVATIALGTELIVSRRGYRHYGIYVGDGRVVHYAGRISYPRGLVEEVSIADFTAGRRIHVGDASNERIPGADVVRRARSRLGERRYDLLQNNCEHFSSWCQNGEPRSAQAEALTQSQRLLVRTLEHAALAARRWFRRVATTTLGFPFPHGSGSGQFVS